MRIAQRGGGPDAAGKRIESALLPFVGYRVFTPDRREQALAWVLEGAGGEGAR